MSRTDYHDTLYRGFSEKYRALVAAALTPDGKKIFLGEPDKSKRTCRYCGKSHAQTKFSNESHAFPFQMGNRRLIDNLECNACNSHFSKHLEDDFAKYFNPVRAACRISGRKGVPSHGNEKTPFSMRFIDFADMEIVLNEGSIDEIYDAETRTLSLDLERQPYHPTAIYKTFLKMAIAVMPESLQDRMAENKAWLLREDHSSLYRPLPAFQWFIPGPREPSTIYYALAQAITNESCELCFMFAIANYQIQIPIVTRYGAGKPFTMPILPPIVDADHVQVFGEPVLEEIDFFSVEKIRGDAFKLKIQFEGFEEGDV